MGPAQADRALDDPNLALCVRHRSSRLFDALPMVPSAGALIAVASVGRHAIALSEGGSLADLLILAQCDMGWGQRTQQPQLGKWIGCQNLALDSDLMFDQSDMPPRPEKTLW